MAEELFDFKKISIEEIIEIIFRRRFLLIIPVIIVFTIALCISILSVPMYRSSAMLAVPALRDNARDVIFRTVNADLQKDNLIKGALKELEISGYKNRQLAAEELVPQIRKGLSTGIAGGALATEINYVGPDPIFCQKFLSVVATNLVNDVENTMIGQIAYAVTAAQERVGKTQKAFEESVPRMEGFLNEYPLLRMEGSAPIFRDLNKEKYKEYEDTVKKIDDALKELELKKMDIQKKLDKEPEFGVSTQEIAQGTGETSKEAPNKEALTKLLTQLESELIKLQLTYQPEHPDIQRIQENIAEIRNALAPKQTPKTPVQKIETIELETDTPNPKYIELKEAKEMLDEAILQRQAQKKKQEEMLTQYAKKMQELPTLERKYVDFKADYEATKRSFEDAKNELSRQKDAFEKEKAKGPYLVIARNPGLPSAPFWPNRAQIITVGFFFGLLIGGGFAYLAEINDASIRHADKLRVLLNLPVLGSIAQMVTPQETKKVKMINKIFFYGTAIFFVSSIIVIFFVKTVLK